MSHQAAFDLEQTLSNNHSITNLYLEQTRCDSLTTVSDQFTYFAHHLFATSTPPQCVFQFGMITPMPLKTLPYDVPRLLFSPRIAIIRTNGFLNDKTRTNWLMHQTDATHLHLLVDGDVAFQKPRTLSLYASEAMRVEFSVPYNTLDASFSYPMHPVTSKCVVFAIAPSAAKMDIARYWDWLANPTVETAVYEGPLMWEKEKERIKLVFDVRLDNLLFNNDFSNLRRHVQQCAKEFVLSLDIIQNGDEFDVHDFETAVEQHATELTCAMTGIVLNFRLLNTKNKTIQWLNREVADRLRTHLAPLGYFEAWFDAAPFPYIMNHETDPVRYSLP